MSRGLGKLQREIIATLEEAKQTMVSYHGSAWYPGVVPFCEPGWVYYKGTIVQLREDVYDIRASFKFLASRHRERFHESVFQASFSRAVKGLVTRRILEVLNRQVPIINYGPDAQPRVHFLSDGEFFDIWGIRQIRFVARSDVPCVAVYR